jgi:hypothetical protein
MRRPTLSGRTTALLLAALAGLLAWAVAVTSADLSPATRPSLALPGADYSRDHGAPFQPVSPAFLAQTLGLSPGVAPPTGTSRPGDAGMTRIVHSVTAGCVGGHQTADPLSPPCIPQFSGSNGGSTYAGVTGSEIRLLVYHQPDAESGRAGAASLTGYVDVDRPGGAISFGDVAAWQGLERYFNHTYQLYGRRVHVILYYDRVGGADTALATQRLEEAIANYLDVQPFAVLYEAPDRDADVYLRQMRAFGVVTFTSSPSETGSSLASLAPYVWSYYPTLEEQADLYSSYVCDKVVRYPVALGGVMNGQRRRLGMIATNQPVDTAYLELAALVRRRVEACGGQIVAEATFPDGGLCNFLDLTGIDPIYGVPDPSTVDYGFAQLARFRLAGVTTILWPGCPNDGYGVPAVLEGYTPEWILLGDGLFDAHDSVTGNLSTFAFDHHAMLVTPIPFSETPGGRYCTDVMAAEDEPPQAAGVGCPDEYTFARFVFTALQAAGPRLDPGAVARGLRGLPTIGNGDPQQPACKFSPGDQTCVHDAQVEYWDAAARTAAQLPGCWRAIQSGERYRAGAWPAGNVDAQVTGREPCNGYDPPSGGFRY